MSETQDNLQRPLQPTASHRKSGVSIMALAALLMAAPLGCDGGKVTLAPSNEPEPEPELEPICVANAAPFAGEQVFAEETASRGLEGVVGVRLIAVDFDGDGWTDLLVHRGGNEPDELGPPPACCADKTCADDVKCPVRRTWLMRNDRTGAFVDVTVKSGILGNRTEPDPNLGRPGTVRAFADVDNDGDLDVYSGVASTPEDPAVETSEILLNQGDGTFVLGPETSDLRLTQESPAGATFFDYDRNGVVDLLVGQNTVAGTPQQDQVYWGAGDGSFVYATAALGMLTTPWASLAELNAGLSHTVSWGTAACDLNNDGALDLLSASYGRSPNHLWMGGGPEQSFGYTNHSVASGYAYDERQDWSDNESARCYCKYTPDAPDCAGVMDPQYIVCNSASDGFRWSHQNDREPFRLGGNSGTTVCGDIDNDGDIDLLTTEIVHWDVGSSSDPSEILVNDGAGSPHFSRPGNETTGLVRERNMVDWNDGDISGAMFDFDNDGWKDIYIGSTDYPGAVGLLYHQDSPLSFSPVPVGVGIDHHRSHGIAVADFDRDGDLDVIVGHSRARCSGSDDCYETRQVRFFDNVRPTGNWFQLALIGNGTANRSAIGARITVTTEDGLKQVFEVGGGHGHYGMQNDLVQHVGLGRACGATVEVRWPDASLSVQTIEVVSGYRFALVQGEAKATVVTRGD